uniref:Uncharacterized protein n=1 Tax=Meloidogyne javanica TaxID=6303 RepID=A0A915N7S5_MELJA
RSSSRSHSSLEQEHVADREQARRRHKALAQRREPISDYLSSKFYGEDMTVCKVKIPRVGPPINRKVTETPQTLIEKAVTALDKGEGRIASELLWMAASLQIKNLCISSGFDILDDLAKRIVVLYLMTKFQGGRYSSISHGWAVLLQCHENLFSIDFIRKNLQHAEYFCNTLFNIFSEGKRIDYDDLTKDISYSSKIVKIKYPSIYETFKLAGEIIAFQYKASEIKWKVRGDAESILVINGSFDLSLEFKGKTKKIFCSRCDFIKIYRGVSCQLETYDFAEITRFMEKDYSILN